jgi:predicted ATPase
MDGLVVITGAPGSGKTAIVRELVALGYGGVPEPAREVIAQQRANGVDKVYDADPRMFLDLMLSRAIEDHGRASRERGPTFFDRAIPDQIGYAELFGSDTSDAVAAAGAHRYDERVFVLPSWPEIYVTDGDRRMTFEDAKVFGDRIRQIYVDLGYTIVDVARDTVAARVRFVLDTLGLKERQTSER